MTFKHHNPGKECCGDCDANSYVISLTEYQIGESIVFVNEKQVTRINVRRRIYEVIDGEAQGWVTETDPEVIREEETEDVIVDAKDEWLAGKMHFALQAQFATDAERVDVDEDNWTTTFTYTQTDVEIYIERRLMITIDVSNEPLFGKVNREGENHIGHASLFSNVSPYQHPDPGSINPARVVVNNNTVQIHGATRDTQIPTNIDEFVAAAKKAGDEDAYKLMLQQ